MARGKNIGGIFAELTLRDKKFRSAILRADKVLAKFASAGVAAAKKIAKLGAVMTAAAAGAMVIGTKRIIGMGAEMEHLAQQTGIAIDEMIKIQQAYKDAGIGAERTGRDINKMQQAISQAAQGRGEAANAFEILGLDPASLKAMDPSKQFEVIGAAIAGIENEADRAGAAMDIFGRSGGQLMTVFRSADFKEIEQSLGRYPQLMEEFGNEFERADTIMGRFSQKSDQFFAGFASGIIDQILPGLEMVNDKDFTELGEKLGRAVSTGFQLILDGTIGQVFLNEMKIAFLEIDKMLGGFILKLTTLADSAKKAPAGFAGSLSEQIQDNIKEFAGFTPLGLGLKGADSIFGESNEGREFNEQFLKAFENNQKFRDDASDKLRQSSLDLIEESAKKVDQKRADAIIDNLGVNADPGGLAESMRKAQKEIEEQGRAARENPVFDDIGANLLGINEKLLDSIEKDFEGAEDVISSDPLDTTREVNAMQRRGLGVGAITDARNEKDQLQVLKDIKGIFSGARLEDKQLVW